MGPKTGYRADPRQIDSLRQKFPGAREGKTYPRVEAFIGSFYS